MTQSTPQSQPGKGLAIATLASIFGTIVVNTLSNLIPPGGESVGEIANTELDGVLILPASYAFAIWGLIYVGLIAYGFYQLRPAQRQNPVYRRASMLLIVACAAQIAWIFLFSLRQYWVSLLAMLVILLSLIGIYLALGIGQQPSHRKERWNVQVPFSIYLAWISVATIVNVASALFASGWQGGPLSVQAWTVVMLVVGAVVAAIAALQRTDVAFTLVFIWAYVAIAIRQANTPAIWLTAVIASVILLGLLLWARQRRPNRLSSS